MVKNCLLFFGFFLFILFARNVMGEIPPWVNFKSGALVFVGTIVGGIMAFPVHTLRGFFAGLRNSMKSQTTTVADVIKQIVALARLHRVASLGEMNRKINAIRHPVMRRGFQMILDHHDRQRVERMLEKEVNLYLDQLQSQLNVVYRFYRLAPIFGFVGTIIGLINVLNNIGNPGQIGQGMAAALLTTFYGLLFANFLFLPLAGRFSEYARREALMLNVIYDGIVSISDRRPPLEIAHSLISYTEADYLLPQPGTPGRQKQRSHWGGSIKKRGHQVG